MKSLTSYPSSFTGTHKMLTSVTAFTCDYDLEHLTDFTFNSEICFSKSSFATSKRRFCSFTSLWRPYLTEGLGHKNI